MNRRFFLTTIIIFESLTVFCQKTLDKNAINISYTPKYYFNKTYVDNNSIHPNPIRPNNTTGYSIGACFERTTKYGLILEGGFEYGIQKHDVHLIQDMSGFDPDATTSLKGLTFDRHIELRNKYLSPRVMVGYNLPITRNLAIVAKIGISIYLFYNGLKSNQSYTVSYQLDDGTPTSTGFLTENVNLGDENRKWTDHSFTNPLHTYEGYLGVERRVKTVVIKTINVGVQITRSINQHSPPGFIQVNSWGNTQQRDQNINNIDWYRNQNLSVGLRMSLGLWK